MKYIPVTSLSAAVMANGDLSTETKWVTRNGLPEIVVDVIRSNRSVPCIIDASNWCHSLSKVALQESLREVIIISLRRHVLGISQEKHWVIKRSQCLAHVLLTPR